MRSLILATAALLSATAFAQKTASSLPTDRPASQEMNIGESRIEAGGEMTNSDFIIDDGSRFEPVAIVMERDFRDCIQGNLDREDLERVHGEIR